MSVSTSNTSLLSLVPPPSRSGSSYFAYTFPPFYRFLLGVLMSLSNPQCLTILWAYPLVHLPQPQWLPVLPLSGLKPHLFPCRRVPPLGPCLLYLHPWREALQWPNQLLCLYCLCLFPPPPPSAASTASLPVGPPSDTTLFNFCSDPRFVPSSALAETKALGFYTGPAVTVNDNLLVTAKATSQVASAAHPSAPFPSQVPPPTTPVPTLSSLHNHFGTVILVLSPLWGDLVFVYACSASPYKPTLSPFPVPLNTQELVTPSQSISQVLARCSLRTPFFQFPLQSFSPRPCLLLQACLHILIWSGWVISWPFPFHLLLLPYLPPLLCFPMQVGQLSLSP